IWPSERYTQRRGRSVVPETLVRTRACTRRRCRSRDNFLTLGDATVVSYYHYVAPPAFAPALPAFFFKRSPVMRMPFCLYGSGGRNERISAATWPTWPLSAPLTTMWVCLSTAI